MRGLLLLLLSGLTLSLGSCGTNDTNNAASQTATELVALHSGNGLDSLPIDGVQPWESVDSRGFVISPQRKGTSAFSPDSYFAPGIERFLEGGGVTDDGEASTLTSTTGSLSYAIYRFPMGGVQPSAVAVDVNLREVGGKKSRFWVGTSNFGEGVWDWSGPHDDGQIVNTIVAGSNHLSSTGSFFVSVMTHEESSFDIVGITVSQEDTADTSAPPAPAAPVLSGIAGGIEMSWTDVIAADLAGYQVYWSYSPFTSPADNGVNELEWVENTNRMVLPIKQPRNVWIAISAVDVHCNESALSPVVSGRRTGMSGLNVIHLSTPQVSVKLGEPVTLTASGADSYDFDTDGDGVFDITGNTTGIAGVDTSVTGLIRPRVRGSSSSGTAVAFGSVSLIVSGNQRPVANAQCAPSFGYAPLAVDMNGTGEDFDGSITEYAWDFDGDGIYDHNSAADGLTAENYTATGLYNAKLRVTDDQGAWDVDTVSVQVLQAEVDLTATPPVAQFGEQVHLHLSLPGAGTNIEWDLDGNGTFETNTVASPDAYTSFNSGGERKLLGRGTVDGKVLVGSERVLVHGTTIASPNPDSAGDVGYYTSLEVVNGKPAISYYDQTNGYLKYVRASNPDGSAWGAPQTPDSTGSVGLYTSLAVVNGNPAISYYDLTNGDLKYVRASNAGGTAWGAPMTVDGGGFVGHYTSLAVVNGNPAISYYDLTNGDLKFVRATDANGSTWGFAPQALDSAGDVGYYTSLAVVNGNPAISYFDFTNGDLKFVRASNADGSGAWGALLTPDGVGDVGHYTSLAVVNGFPAISYWDATNNDLKYVRASNAAGSAWGTPTTLDSTGSVGAYTSLAVVNGIAAISYYDGNNGDLKYLRAGNADGSSWGAPLTLDSAGGVGLYTSLAVVNGNPAVSYSDGDNGYLKYLMIY